MDNLEQRILTIEVNQGVMAETMIDIKERVDNHKYCMLPEHKESENKTFISLKESIDGINTRFNTVLGIVVTIFVIYFSALGYLQNNKVDNETFKSTISESKQEEVRRDERIQMLTEQQQQLQIALIKEMNEVKIEVARLSNNLRKY